MFIEYIDKILFALVSFGFGYFYGKSGGKLIEENIKKQISKAIKGKTYGAVIKPRSQQEINKEQEEDFYEKL